MWNGGDEPPSVVVVIVVVVAGRGQRSQQFPMANLASIIAEKQRDRDTLKTKICVISIVVDMQKLFAVVFSCLPLCFPVCRCVFLFSVVFCT